MPYNPFEDLPETTALVLLIAGFIIAVLARSTFFQLAIIILAGLAFGRLLYRWKPHRKTSLVLIMLGFLLGYLMGSAGSNHKILVVLFGLSVWGGWALERKNLLPTVSFS